MEDHVEKGFLDNLERLSKEDIIDVLKTFHRMMKVRTVDNVTEGVRENFINTLDNLVFLRVNNKGVLRYRKKGHFDLNKYNGGVKEKSDSVISDLGENVIISMKKYNELVEFEKKVKKLFKGL